MMTVMFHIALRNSNVSKLLVNRTYTDLQQFYGVAMNPIVKIYRF